MDKNIVLWYDKEAYTIKESYLKTLMVRETQKYLFERYEKTINKTNLLSESKKLLLKEAKRRALNESQQIAEGPGWNAVKNDIKKFFSFLGRAPAKALGRFIRGLKKGWLKGRYNLSDQQINTILNDYSKNAANPTQAAKTATADMVRFGIPAAEAGRLAAALPAEIAKNEKSATADTTTSPINPSAADTGSTSTTSAGSPSTVSEPAAELSAEDEGLKTDLEKYIIYINTTYNNREAKGYQIGAITIDAQNKKMFIPYVGKNLETSQENILKALKSLKDGKLYLQPTNSAGRTEPYQVADSDGRPTLLTKEKIKSNVEQGVGGISSPNPIDNKLADAGKESAIDNAQQELGAAGQTIISPEQEKQNAQTRRKILDAVLKSRDSFLGIGTRNSKFETMARTLSSTLRANNLLDGDVSEYTAENGTRGVYARTNMPVEQDPNKVYVFWINSENLQMGLDDAPNKEQAASGETNTSISESQQKLFRINGKNFKLIK